ncbi:MAG: hypothetical protein MK081_16070 [Flavobacteriales bacterium]|nr:hypothetical protein [Flavobacteriales bacterium]
MTASIHRISFSEVKTILEQVLGLPKGDSFDLIPSQIHRKALDSDIVLQWKVLDNWLDFENGDIELSDSFLIESIFHKIQPKGPVYIVTDECFSERLAYVIESSNLDKFVSEVYHEIHQIEFFQPMDYIFLCPEIQLLSMLHHEGQVTQYQNHHLLGES